MPPDVIGREDATEVLRAFVLDGGLSIAFTRAFEDPEMWGLLLVDIARHAARAYARESEYGEEEALERILEMFSSELERPTDAGSTTPRSPASADRSWRWRADLVERRDGWAVQAARLRSIRGLSELSP